MTDPFGTLYAGAYDTLYGAKDYDAECRILEDIALTHGQPPVQHILDLGCGTGQHAVILAGRGHAVTGVDRSPAMLERARDRAEAAGSTRLHLVQGDVRTVDLGQQLDVVLLMFAVLGYQISDADVVATLSTARQHLRRGGLLLFDVWYGPAVESEGPSDRTKVVQEGGAVIERRASGELDRTRHTCTVRYHLSVRAADGSGVRETDETHTMRYFFSSELRSFLEDAGLDLVRLTSFPSVEEQPSHRTWNVLAVSVAR